MNNILINRGDAEAQRYKSGNRVKVRRMIFICAVLVFSGNLFSWAQELKSGFDADEYLGALERCAMQVESSLRGNIPAAKLFEKMYRSEPMGMHNKWDLWLSKDKKTIAINLRGTTSNTDSWIENFYSAMIPATGSLNLDGKTPFPYKFAADPRAKVHVGWAVGICSLIPDILKQLDKYYAMGVRQVIVEGHSQGGALSFLLSSFLRYQAAEGKLPKDLVIKTYCSGAPKPGNVYYAYDFDYITRGGWAYNVVSTKDWVPEMPITVQTKHDINNDPYQYTKSSLRKQNFLVRYYIKRIYGSMDRSTRKAQRKYEKFLGRMMYKQVRKYMDDFEQPAYAGSSNYARAGVPIVLQPDSEYAVKFPDSTANLFTHHLFEPYYYLVKKTYP